MKLRKINERAERNYDAEGVMTERVTSATYKVVDDNGVEVGTVNCWPERADLGIAVQSQTVEEGVERIASMIGATIAEEGGEV